MSGPLPGPRIDVLWLMLDPRLVRQTCSTRWSQRRPAALDPAHGRIDCTSRSCAHRRLDAGAPGRTRTGTSFLTAPSRQRVYQFRHRRVGRPGAGVRCGQKPRPLKRSRLTELRMIPEAIDAVEATSVLMSVRAHRVPATAMPAEAPSQLDAAPPPRGRHRVVAAHRPAADGRERVKRCVLDVHGGRAEAGRPPSTIDTRAPGALQSGRPASHLTAMGACRSQEARPRPDSQRRRQKKAPVLAELGA